MTQENTREFYLDLENPNLVVRASQLEQSVFNFVWTVLDIPKEPDSYFYMESPIFKDPETGNEWRLKLKPDEDKWSYSCLTIQLVGRGSGQLTQLSLERSFLDSGMKSSLQTVKLSSNAYQIHGGNEKVLERLRCSDIFGETSSLVTKDNSLNIHICLKTTLLYHKNFSGLSNRKCQVEILAQQLQNLWPNDKFSDVTLVTENATRFPASKLILAANSPVFHAMFTSEMKEAKENEVRIPGFSDDVLKAFLEFVYICSGTGSDSENEQTDDKCTLKENAAELLKFSEKYDVKHLKEECERILIQNLTIESAADMLYLATFFNSPALKEKVVQFFNRYRKEVQNTPSFKQMKIQNPQVLIEFYSELN